MWQGMFLFDLMMREEKIMLEYVKIFERVLTQIAPVVREEQLFCVNFFNFLEEETISGDVSDCCFSSLYSICFYV